MVVFGGIVFVSVTVRVCEIAVVVCVEVEELVVGWVGGSGKVQQYADIILGWSLYTI